MENSILYQKFQGFQLIAQEKLQAIICSIPGKKDLIIEPKLIKPLEYICTASWLKLKGIQRILKLDDSNAITRSTTDQVQVYMVYSEVRRLIHVLGQIKTIYESQLPTWTEETTFKYFHIISVPSSLTYFATLVEEEGLHGIVDLHHFNWGFILLDDGLLSMELPNMFPSVYLRSDYSLLPAISHTLRILQTLCGNIDMVLTYGLHSENIMKIVKKLGPLPNRSLTNEVSEFSALLVIDRDKDYVSTLLTPAIYSGLLLEVFKYNAGVLELDMNMNKILDQKIPIFVETSKKFPAKNKASPSSEKPLKLWMNSQQDDIYARNRYKQFSAASSDIRCQAKTISTELQKLNDMKIEEMDDYVSRKLPRIADLRTKLMSHVSASEKLVDMLGANYRKVQSLERDILCNTSRKKILKEIDELLISDGQRYNILRLLCLFHICVGLNELELIQFIRNYTNYFGAKNLPIFEKLALADLLPIMDIVNPLMNRKVTNLLSNISLNISKLQQTSFQANANRLRLIHSAVDDIIRNDLTQSVNLSGLPNVIHNSSISTTTVPCPTYVFNGLYVPLIAQLCNLLLKANCTDDLTSKLIAIENIKLNGHTIKTYSQFVKHGNLKELLPLTRRQLLVYVVGSVSYAEIAACHLIAKLTDSQIFVATDSIMCGSDLIAGAF